MLEDRPGITATTYGAELNALSGRGNGAFPACCSIYPIAKKVSGAQPGTTALRTAPSAGLVTALQLRKEAGPLNGKSTMRLESSSPARTSRHSFELETLDR